MSDCQNITEMTVMNYVHLAKIELLSESGIRLIICWLVSEVLDNWP